MDSINLNSESYTNNEIEKLLHLRPPYNLNDIIASKEKLINQFGKNQYLGNREKQQSIISFIESISFRLKNQNNILGGSYNNNYNNNSNIVIEQGSNFIIENPDVSIGKNARIEDGRITLDSNVAPPGNLNPINVRTITQAISIDSRFRPNYNTTKSTNYDIILPSIQKNVINMRVASIELPTTYYAISSYNGNSTCLIADLSNVGQGWLLTLPDGNYEQSWANNSNAADVSAAMNAAIQAASPVTINSNGTTSTGSGPTLTTNDLNFILDRVSGKSIFDVSGGILDPSGFKINFNVDISGNKDNNANIQMRLGWQLGYRKAEYTTTTQAVSEGICLVCGPRYGFISIDDHQKNTGPAYMVAYANSILQNNIITRINLAELIADSGVYQSTSDPGLSTQLNRMREYFGPVDIQRLHISLYDEYGRIIDLNNMDWSITLAFELLYN
jgi:hypothetical protein